MILRDNVVVMYQPDNRDGTASQEMHHRQPDDCPG